MKNQIPLIVIAVFFISILLTQIGVVFAQVFTVVTDMEERVRAISYQSATDSFWVLAEGGGFTWLHQIDRSTRSNIFSYNHTQTFDDLSAGVTQDIWCGQTSCYITTTGGLLVGITTEDISPNIFKGINVTGTYNHVNTLGHLTGRDQVSGGFGSVTLWIDTFTGTARNIIIVDGISFTLTGTLPSYGTTGVDERVHDIRWSKVAGITDNDLITSTGFITDTSAQNSIVVYNLATLAIKCNVATASTNNPLAVAPNYIGAGDSNNKFYVGSIDGIVYVYNENTCAVVQTFTTGLTGDLRFLDYDSGRLFVQENGANALIKQFAVNSTGFILSTNSTYSPLPSVTQNTFDSVETTLTNARGWLLAGNGQFWFPYTGNDEKVGILIYDATPGGTGGGEPITICYVVEGTGQMICKTYETDENGNPIIPSTIGGVNPRNITDTSNDLFCSLGITNCDNTDIKTNGTGMFMLLILLLVSYALVVYIHHIAKQSIMGIHPMLVLLIGIIDISIAFFLGWIPDYIFYSVIVLLIGLGGFGLYKIVRGM